MPADISTSALNHPNVCVIHALGRTGDGRRFIAMEHVEGETLRERLRRGGPPSRDTLDVAIQIASALTAAHAAGSVHRDVKRENVMVRRDPLVKVLDFGLAKLAPAAEALAADATHTALATEPGSRVGTTRYMGAGADARPVPPSAGRSRTGRSRAPCRHTARADRARSPGTRSAQTPPPDTRT